MRKIAVTDDLSFGQKNLIVLGNLNDTLYAAHRPLRTAKNVAEQAVREIRESYIGGHHRIGMTRDMAALGERVKEMDEELLRTYGDFVSMMIRHGNGGA